MSKVRINNYNLLDKWKLNSRKHIRLLIPKSGVWVQRFFKRTIKWTSIAVGNRYIAWFRTVSYTPYKKEKVDEAENKIHQCHLVRQALTQFGLSKRKLSNERAIYSNIGVMAWRISTSENFRSAMGYGMRKKEFVLYGRAALKMKPICQALKMREARKKRSCNKITLLYRTL